MIKPIYTLDTETDPFLYGRDPIPFLCGLYTGDKFYSTWGVDCIERMHKKMLTLPPGIIYVHNGGKFDFYYYMDWIAMKKPLMIINGRIVRAYLWGNNEQPSEFRDSFAIMPFALKQYKKMDVDIRTFEKENRDKHKRTLVQRVKTDCVYLHELCVEYHDRFGDSLTVGSTAMKEIKKVHKFDNLDAKEDKLIRTSYYYGGRVQCFEKGIIEPTKGNKIVAYDLNQAYPYSMRDFMHPISKPDTRISDEITDNTYFLTVRGRNYGAFPKREKNGLHFDIEHDTFSVSIHEYKAAIDTGLFETEDVIECINFQKASTFKIFVDKFHLLRRNAQLTGDRVGALLYKYVGNSGYGKFAQCPDNYYNYVITDECTNMNQLNDPDGYHPCTVVGFSGYILWKQHSYSTSRYNVATGASITGGTRSLLIRALAKAIRPLYCDTDSLVCEGLSGVEIDDTKIGAWKIEKTCTSMAIAGRKLYALYDGNVCVKMASKGVHLTADEIKHVATGHQVTWKKDAPTFDFKTHSARYLKRTVRMT